MSAGLSGRVALVTGGIGTAMVQRLPEAGATVVGTTRDASKAERGTTAEVADLAVAMLGDGSLTGRTMLLDGGLLPR